MLCAFCRLFLQILHFRALAHAKALDCTFSDLLRVALEQFLTTLPPLPVMPDDELPSSVS